MMFISSAVYKISEIQGFNKLLTENGNPDSDSETLKLCKTNVVTRNNQQYKVEL